MSCVHHNSCLLGIKYLSGCCACMDSMMHHNLELSDLCMVIA